MVNIELAHYWGNFHFLRPNWLLLLIPVSIVCFYYYRQSLRKNNNKQRSNQTTIAPHLYKALRCELRPHHRYFSITAVSLLLVVFVFILAGPTWSRQSSPFQQDGAALYVVLDVSSSMDSTDIQPSRLERGKQKIRDLLLLRPSSRNALIVYAGTAHSVLPLSNDGIILENYLHAISTDVMPKAGKFAENILPILEGAIEDDDHLVNILLISDGISDQSIDAFSQYFKKHRYNLMVLGVGLQEYALSEQHIANHIPALDRRGLLQLVDSVDGHFFDLSVDQQDVRQINARIDSFMVVLDDGRIPWHDKGYYLVFVGLLLLLPWFRRGVVLSTCLMGIALSISAPTPVYAGVITDAWLTNDQQGRWHFERGDYLVAAKVFDNLLWKATAYYIAEDFVLASEYFSRINSLEAQFGRANSLAHAQYYLAAVTVYDDILLQHPECLAALKNRTIVQKIIDAINLLSASQQTELGESSSIRNGKDQPLRADGAIRRVFSNHKIEQFSARDILQNKALNEKWMRSVEPDPSKFLKVKFHLQAMEQ